MPVTRIQYEEIIRRQLDGTLTIMIDTSGFRQVFARADPQKMSALVGRPVRTSLGTIRVLTCAPGIAMLVTAGFAVPALSLWTLLVVPVLIVVWLLYMSRASFGAQSLGGVCVLLAFAVVAAVAASNWSIWLRTFILSAAITFFLSRLLYVITSRLVFLLVHSSYEFFATFYRQPEDAVVPLLWTQPEIES